MVRARRPFNQIPMMAMLLLVLLATLPVLQVSSDTNTPGNQSADPATADAALPGMMDQPSPTAATITQPLVADAVMGGRRPVAQLIPPPDGLQSVSFTLGDGEGAPPQSGGATLLASGEYAAKGHVIVVSTFQADGAAPSSLGPQPIVLADGTPAWATPGPHGKAPNQVALLQDGLIVTLSGDLSIDDLASLASAVVIRW